MLARGERINKLWINFSKCKQKSIFIYTDELFTSKRNYILYSDIAILITHFYIGVSEYHLIVNAIKFIVIFFDTNLDKK